MCSLLTIGFEGWTGGINYIMFPHKTDRTNCFWESACCVITLPSSWIKGCYSRKSLLHGGVGGGPKWILVQTWASSPILSLLRQNSLLLIQSCCTGRLYKTVTAELHCTRAVFGICETQHTFCAPRNSLQCIFRYMFSSLLRAFVQVCYWVSWNLQALDTQTLLPSSCWCHWWWAVSASHRGSVFFFSCRLLWCWQTGKVLWLRRWRLWNPIPLKTNRKLTLQICVMCGEKGGREAPSRAWGYRFS